MKTNTHPSLDAKVADFFAVIGLDESICSECLSEYLTDNNTIYQVPFESRVIDHYPNDELLLNPIPEGIEYFCFPDGIHLMSEQPPLQSHSFIHTSEDGSRLVGCALVFYEEVDDSVRQLLSVSDVVFLPKAICLLSQRPFITSFKQFLHHLYSLTKSKDLTIPIERFICNFIDDVPSPPPGKVDVHYYIDDVAIKFQCPPINEPNVWTGFPLTSLFACLSIDNVLSVLTLLLVERQILLISEKYDNLTLCAEAITSLLYPFHWVHAYIPILPTRLLGALGAPFPFIFGIHRTIYELNKSMVAGDTVKVFLDNNVIEFGNLGAPPSLPERRHRKLMTQLKHVVPVLLADVKPSSRHATPRPSLTSKEREGEQSAKGGDVRPQESVIRESFLKLFVAIFKDYKKYLIYPSVAPAIDVRAQESIDHRGKQELLKEETEDEEEEDSGVNSNNNSNNPRFLFDEFTVSQPSDFRPLISQMMPTQLFSQFIDERTVMSKLDKDVIFFDESIDAKLNRYTFRLHSHIDTPFLLHTSQRHIKTYVPPSPATQDLLPATYIYEKFPKLNPSLFVAPRNLTAKFPRSSEQLMNLLSRVRLKRKSSQHMHSSKTSNKAKSSDATVTAAEGRIVLSGMSCVYSCHLICLSRLISVSIENIAVTKHRPSIVTTKRVIDEYSSTSSAVLSRARENSMYMNTSFFLSSSSSSTATQTSPKNVIAAAQLALRVALEILNCLLRCDYMPDEVVYRCLAEACADLKAAGSLIDLIVLMDEEGYLPDHHIKHALVRALTPSHLIPINFPPELPATSSTGEGSKVSQSNASSNINRMKFSERVKRCFGIEPAEVWSFEHWASLRRPAATSSIVLRSSVPAEFGGSPRYWDKDGKHVTANYFTAAISSSTSAHGPAEPSLLSPRTTHKTSEHGPPPSSSTTRSQSTSSSSSSLPQSRAARRKDAWSINRLEGLIPQLTWNNIGKTFHPNGERRSYAASKKLHRLIQRSEDLLTRQVSQLEVDLTAGPGGMLCPGINCGIQRPLTLSELMQGWESFQGDPNKYTVRCVYCGREFIPRFSVRSNDLTPGDDLLSSQVASRVQWFELLSPWVLYKEVSNLIFEDGIHAILLNDLRPSPKLPQKAVIFWNLVVYFRLRGLPFSFLLTNGLISEAFPLSSPAKETPSTSSDRPPLSKPNNATTTTIPAPIPFPFPEKNGKNGLTASSPATTAAPSTEEFPLLDIAEMEDAWRSHHKEKDNMSIFD